MFEEFYEMYEPEEQEVVALINRCIGGGYNWKGNFWEMTVVTLGDVYKRQGIPFAENTELRGEILLCPGVFGTDSFFCRLPDGDEGNCYQVIPLYREEIQYKLEHGSDALLDLCPD